MADRKFKLIQGGKASASAQADNVVPLEPEFPLTPSQGQLLIKRFESLALERYTDPSGTKTIGWGHTGRGTEQETCTEEEAQEFFWEDLIVAEKAVKRCIDVPLTMNQFAALVSFTFNLGGQALEGSSVRRWVNKGEHGKVASSMVRRSGGQWKGWVKATAPNGGKVTLPGLVLRRAAEAQLYLTPPVPQPQELGELPLGSWFNRALLVKEEGQEQPTVLQDKHLAAGCAIEPAAAWLMNGYARVTIGSVMYWLPGAAEDRQGIIKPIPIGAPLV